jgi:ribokinase
MANILVIGSTNTDLVIKTSRFPTPGETLLGGQYFQFAGGKGANQAVAASRLGAEVSFLTKLGRDEFGKQSLLGFQRAGIHTDLVRYAEEVPSGVAVILVDDAGENQIVVASGANEAFTIADLEGFEATVAKADILLLQLEIPLPTVVHAIERAYQVGKRVLLNPAPARQLPASIYPQLFAITPNESEAALLCGFGLDSPDTVRRAAEHLRALGTPNVVITLGKEGSFYLGEAGAFHVPAPQVTAVDTTAAGDVFNGALAVALAQQKDWRAAIEWASRAAAHSVTRLGAQDSAPFLREMT